MKNLIRHSHPNDTNPVVVRICTACDAGRWPSPVPAWPPRRVFAGKPGLLRALRAAEMALWQATGGDYLRSTAVN